MTPHDFIAKWNGADGSERASYPLFFNDLCDLLGVERPQPDAALAHWSYIAPLLTPATTEAEYQALVESLDAVLDAGGADETHPLAGLAVMLGDLVSAWEHTHYPMPPEMSGVEVLRFLMSRDGLRQSDLPEIGNQAKVSEILSGKREINLRQAKALAARFGVPIGLFAD